MDLPAVREEIDRHAFRRCVLAFAVGSCDDFMLGLPVVQFAERAEARYRARHGGIEPLDSCKRGEDGSYKRKEREKQS